ncbi:unnamed protein product [Euphydryas editha]|uniref:Uncharacterized protein n=1 Tax=Euphydryas editha TaxID=104508 RepID=A0AAU9TEW1_EUPED|nr:unnamed protein product [Euphydryas editha]
MRKLLEKEEIGDRKPSVFLRYLQRLAGTNAPEKFLRTLWTSRLPQQTQIILASQPDDAPLEVQANLADKIHDVFTPPISSLSQSLSSLTQPSTSDNKIASLEQKINELMQKVEKISLSSRRKKFFQSP